MLTRGGKHIDQGHRKGLPYSKVMTFEIHSIPLRSRLEEWRKEVTAMRAANWPYSRIAEWLQEEKGVGISREAVRQFCAVRGILKGIPNPPGSVTEPPLTVARSVPRIRRQRAKAKLFDYDDSQPIERKRS